MIRVESQVHRFWPEVRTPDGTLVHPEIRIVEGLQEFPQNCSEETKKAIGRLVAAGLARTIPNDAAPVGDPPKTDEGSDPLRRQRTERAKADKGAPAGDPPKG
jgi:hypothetical protein